MLHFRGRRVPQDLTFLPTQPLINIGINRLVKEEVNHETKGGKKYRKGDELIDKESRLRI